MTFDDILKYFFKNRFFAFKTRTVTENNGQVIDAKAERFLRYPISLFTEFFYNKKKL